MSKPLSVRLDDIHAALLDAIIEKLESDGAKTSKTDVIQNGIYRLAYDLVLGSDKVGEIIDKHYRGPLKDL